MKYISVNLLFLFLFLTHGTFAQLRRLKLEDAVSVGLKSNFSILISNNDREIAKNNNTLGNAGFLPQLGADGVVNKSYQQNKTENATGDVSTGKANSSVVKSWINVKLDSL